MAGQRVCDLYAYGLVQHIPHKSYMAQIYYATTFAVFCSPFADPSRIFRGHMLKPFYINANTRTFRSMLTCMSACVRTGPGAVHTSNTATRFYHGQLACRVLVTTGTLIIRIGLWGIFYYNYHEEPQNSVGNLLRPPHISWLCAQASQ